MEHYFSNIYSPAVVSLSGGMPVIAPCGAPVSAETVIGMIERNPDLIVSEQAGFCYNPLLCIGKDVQLGTGPVADLLMMSPYGYIVAISASSFETGCTFAKTYKDCEDYASALKSMSYRELDDIALDYTYNRTSKGCTIVGAMGDAGYLNYEDEALLIRQTELNLRRSRFLYIAIVQDADIEKDFCLEDEQFGVGFLCVKTYGTESPFAVASLKIIESE